MNPKHSFSSNLFNCFINIITLVKTVPNEKSCFQDATNTLQVFTNRQLLPNNNWKIQFSNCLLQEELIHQKIPVNPFKNLLLCCFKSQVSSIVYLLYTNWKGKQVKNMFFECRASWSMWVGFFRLDSLWASHQKSNWLSLLSTLKWFLVNWQIFQKNQWLSQPNIFVIWPYKAWSCYVLLENVQEIN